MQNVRTPRQDGHCSLSHFIPNVQSYWRSGPRGPVNHANIIAIECDRALLPTSSCRFQHPPLLSPHLTEVYVQGVQCVLQAVLGHWTLGSSSILSMTKSFCTCRTVSKQHLGATMATRSRKGSALEEAAFRKLADDLQTDLTPKYSGAPECALASTRALPYCPA